jgi:hypothetical protein
MKKALFFILSLSMLFGYDLVLTKKEDVEKLNDIGLLCKKSEVGYICISSYDKKKLIKLKDYLEKMLGIKSFIYDDDKEKIVNTTKKILKTKASKPLPPKKVVVSKIPKKGFCIQVISSKNLNSLKKDFNKVKHFPYSRVEKIKGYYVIRVGQDSSSKKLKNLLKDVKEISKSAFIRKCDYIPARIVEKGR